MENLAGHVFGNEILDTTPKNDSKKKKSNYIDQPSIL